MKAIGNEGFGRCVGEIDVSLGMENRFDSLCCGLIYMSLFGEEERLKVISGGG